MHVRELRGGVNVAIEATPVEHFVVGEQSSGKVRQISLFNADMPEDFIGRLNESVGQVGIDAVWRDEDAKWSIRHAVV